MGYKLLWYEAANALQCTWSQLGVGNAAPAAREHLRQAAPSKCHTTAVTVPQ